MANESLAAKVSVIFPLNFFGAPKSASALLAEIEKRLKNRFGYKISESSEDVAKVVSTIALGFLPEWKDNALLDRKGLSEHAYILHTVNVNIL